MGIDARVVTAILNNKGRVVEMEDEKNPSVLPGDENTSVPYKGLSYNWDLEPLINTGVSRPIMYAHDVNACTSAQGDPAHRNSVACTPATLIKIDVGYWGAYDRPRESTAKPQRDFGVIEGRDVWLCRFNSFGAFNNGASAPPGGSLMAKFILFMEGKGYGIELVKHSTAPVATYTQNIPTNRLTFAFPDLHLPEKWPDEPPTSAYGGMPKAAIEGLIKRLRWAQRENNILTMSVAEQTAIQDHLDKLVSADVPYTYQYLSGSHVGVTPLGGVGLIPDYTSITINRAQFLAVKAHVDRALILKSCWFYSNGPGKNGDAAPAVDLVNMLRCMLDFKTSQGVAMKVYQVGDLYELWLDREFLYRFYTVDDPNAGKDLYLWASNVAANIHDNFQYRMDADWTAGGSAPHPARRYVYHNWPMAELIRRHKVAAAGAGPAAAEIPRLKKILEARIANVKLFQLPLPSTPAAKSIPAATLANYQVPTPSGPEFQWNKMILDLLAKLDFKNIWGNHDGYRGDPSLNGGLSANDKADAYISEPGIWVEHSHRWDDFNRDGMAFGAGVTNLVYYYRDNLLGADVIKGAFMPAEQAAFQPGAAQWFLLVNYATFPSISSGLSGPVLPFGIYISGHTHSADLVEVHFELSATARAQRTINEEAERLRRARAAAGKKAAELLQKGQGLGREVFEDLLERIPGF